MQNIQEKLKQNLLDEDLQKALKQAEKDGIVKIILEQTPPDSCIIVHTKHSCIKIGANDLGFWLKKE